MIIKFYIININKTQINFYNFLINIIIIYYNFYNLFVYLNYGKIN